MKNHLIFGLLVLLILSFISCKPIYKCGDPKPEKKTFELKRTQAVIDERDVLCNTVREKEREILELIGKVGTLEGEIKALQKQYNDLMNENLSQAEQYNMALKQKSDELLAKEKLLQEREKSLREMQQMLERQDSITRRLNDILRNALLGFSSDELSVEIKNGKVYVSMSDKLLFKSGSATVEAKGRDALKVLADVLVKNPDIDILVEGHTDNVPIKNAVYKDNWDLSVARATSIVRILTEEYKIDPKRLTASGKGEFSPRASNATPEGRASNRRTEIILSPKLEEIMKLLKGN